MNDPQTTPEAWWQQVLDGPFAAEIYVAPDGRDDHPGSAAQPLATLEAARAAVRRLQSPGNLPPGAVMVWLRQGVYERPHSFALTEADSGSPANPIIYRAWPGEQVQISGGRRIRGFEPVTDAAVRQRLPDTARAHVLQCDLATAGVEDCGRLEPRGFGQAERPAPLELFFNGVPMTLARWPHEGYAAIADTPAGQTRTDESGLQVPHGHDAFHYHGDRPAAWRHDDDIWMHGFWTWNWADSYVRIAEIDTRQRLIRTAEPHGCYGYRAGQRYYFLNVLDELAAPGQYYVDRQRRRLYFWPPTPLEQGVAVVSLCSEPLATLQDVAYLAFADLDFACGRAGGVTISGGRQCLIADCRIANLGTRAVTVEGGLDHGVVRSEIYACDGGVSLSGGDRAQLTPGGHYAVNNDIHHFSRTCTCYRMGIVLQGVGQRAAHNHVHHAPHIGVSIGGNDHLIEYNEIDHLCAETGDCGAFYMGRDWTMRGNIIRYNYFHHVETQHAGGTMGVYQDDCSSGSTILGNLFYKCNWGVFIGGGRDHRVENNFFIDCAPPICIDARGDSQWSMWRKMVDETMRQSFEAMNPLAPPYSQRYPELAAIANYYAQGRGVPPEGNVIVRNLAHRWSWLMINGQIPLSMIDLRDNYVMNPPHFVDELNADFRLRPDSPALALGIQPLPLDEMGLCAPVGPGSRRSCSP